MKYSRETDNFFNKLLMNNGSLSFHKLNIIGWIMVIIADTLIVSPKDLFASFPLFAQNTIAWSTGIPITILIRNYYKKFDYRNQSISSLLMVILLGSFVIAIIIYILASAIYLISGAGSPKATVQLFMQPWYIASRMTSFYPLMTTWSLLYFGIKIWIDFTKEREKVIKAELFAQQAQLQMLRYQINPHFLFNSFSSLRALTRTEPKKAEEMVTKLSEFYRYSLVSRNHEVTLGEEIEAIILYSEIEKIRFEENLMFEFHIDPVAEVYPIPSFLIHPLVDNAIKYGMKSSPLPLRIIINSEVKNGRLFIEVKNSGKWIPINETKEYYSTGTGINNIKNRLEFSYPGNSSLNVSESEGFVIVKIEIARDVK